MGTVLKSKNALAIIGVLVLVGVAVYVFQQSSGLVVRSNTHIRSQITAFDFVPLGHGLIQNPDESLALSDEAPWYAQNFAPFGMGESDDGHTIIYHNALNVKASRCGAHYWVSVDGSAWLKRSMESSVYYDKLGIKFDARFPTIYVEVDEYFMYLSYDENTRTWHYKVNSPDGYINATAKAYSIPFWMGKPNGPYVVQGLYYNQEDVDLWGGYVDFCTVVTDSNFIDGVDRRYYGVMAMDREYHREHSLPFEGGGWKGCFSAMSLHTDDVDFAVLQAVNPIDGSDNYEGIPFEHQGRLNFASRGKDFTFNDFQYSDNGEVPPNNFHLEGLYDGGYVNLTATSFQTFSWEKGNPTWWNPDLHTYWGRNFVLWNGEITLDQETVRISDAFGFMEGTRVA